MSPPEHPDDRATVAKATAGVSQSTSCRPVSSTGKSFLLKNDTTNDKGRPSRLDMEWRRQPLTGSKTLSKSKHASIGLTSTSMPLISSIQVSNKSVSQLRPVLYAVLIKERLAGLCPSSTRALTFGNTPHSASNGNTKAAGNSLSSCNESGGGVKC